MTSNIFLTKKQAIIIFNEIKVYSLSLEDFIKKHDISASNYVYYKYEIIDRCGNFMKDGIIRTENYDYI